MAETRRTRASEQAEADKNESKKTDGNTELTDGNVGKKRVNETAREKHANGTAALSSDKSDNMDSPLPETAIDTRKGGSKSSRGAVTVKSLNAAVSVAKGEKLESVSPSRKKRRIIDDGDDESDYGDDDDDDDDDTPTSKSLEAKSKNASRLEKSDSSSNGTDDSGKQEAPKTTRSTRNSSRIKNAASLQKRQSINDSDDDDDGDEKNARPSTSSSPKEHASSPSRPSKAASKEDFSQDSSIPKKKVPRKNPPSEGSGGTTSLLAHMSKPPPAPAAASKPQTLNSTAAAPEKKPMLPAVQRTNPTDQAKSPQRLDNPSKGNAPAAAPSGASDASAKEQKLQKYLANHHQSAARSPAPGAQLKWHESKIMKDLSDLCSRFGDGKQWEMSPKNPTGSRVDLSGSFLSKEKQYDFFDTNERGEILIKPRPPIFPEEFPVGMKEHGLAWWGILDPALGDGKFRSSVLPDISMKPPPPKAQAAMSTGRLPPPQQRHPNPPYPLERGGEPPFAPPPYMEREPPFPPQHGREPPFAPPPGRGEPPWGRGPPPGWMNDGPPRGDRFRDGGPPGIGPRDGPAPRGPPSFGRHNDRGPPRNAGRR